MFHLIRVQQAVVDSKLHELSKQVQHLSLQGHRGAGGVLLQGFDHQRLKQSDVVVDDILRKQKEENVAFRTTTHFKNKLEMNMAGRTGPRTFSRSKRYKP